MSKHTLGPWIVNAEQVFGGGHKIASVNDANPNCLDDRDLIAAAPDLLKALRVLVALHGNGPGDSVSMDNARAAIAKAEGGS